MFTTFLSSPVIPSTCLGASGTAGQLRLLGSDNSPVPSGESGGPAFFRGMGTSTIVSVQTDARKV